MLGLVYCCNRTQSTNNADATLAACLKVAATLATSSVVVTAVGATEELVTLADVEDPVTDADEPVADVAVEEAEVDVVEEAVAAVDVVTAEEVDAVAVEDDVTEEDDAEDEEEADEAVVVVVDSWYSNAPRSGAVPLYASDTPSPEVQVSDWSTVNTEFL